MKRYCYALDLKNDSELIETYKDHHNNVWPEIEKSLLDTGIKSLQIYLIFNRLFMIMDTSDDFSHEHKVFIDEKNPKVQEWEKLMWAYQKVLPMANPNEKWVLMELIYNLQSNN